MYQQRLVPSLGRLRASDNNSTIYDDANALQSATQQVSSDLETISQDNPSTDIDIETEADATKASVPMVSQATQDRSNFSGQESSQEVSYDSLPDCG